MALLLRNIRLWWQPPRAISERPEHRQVSFLELFYDLVYVVLIAELTHALALHTDGEHLLQFVLMFVIVWWAWLNGTLYHEIHGNNDIRTRVFTFLQMFTVIAMAVFAHDAFGETGQGFALSFAAFQLILTYLWWRTGVYDPNHRPLSAPYSIFYLLNAIVFTISAFIEPGLRHSLWAISVLGAVLFPLTIFLRGSVRPEVRQQIEASRRTTASLVERLGLFTIIVLGEVIVGVVQGVAGSADLTIEVGIIGGLGMLIAIGLWWIYFDLLSHRHPQQESFWTTFWLYAHLPMTAGIATTGAAVLNVVEHSGDALPDEVRWLLVGAVATSLFAIALLIKSLRQEDRLGEAHQTGMKIVVVAALLILGLGLSDFQAIPMLLSINGLMLVAILLSFFAWLRTMELSQAAAE